MIAIGAVLSPQQMREAIKRLEGKSKLNDLEKAIFKGLKVRLAIGEKQ